MADAGDTEADETITVTVLPGSGYSLGASTFANLTLVNKTETSPPNPKAAAGWGLPSSGPMLQPTKRLPHSGNGSLSC